MNKNYSFLRWSVLIALILVVQSQRLSAGQYYQNFQSSTNGSTNFSDGSQLFSTDLGTAAQVIAGNSKELQLTANGVTGTRTAFLLPDLDPGTQIAAFSAKWNMEVNRSTINDADGFSFNFGNLPTTDLIGTTYLQEAGYNTGISFGVQTFIGNNPGFYLRVNGTTIASQTFNPATKWGSTNVAGRFFELDWHLTNGLSVSMDGTTIFNNVVVTNFVPQAGNRFAFAARCGLFTETLQLDNIMVATRGNLKKISTAAPYYKSAEYVAAGQTADKAFDGIKETKWLSFSVSGYIGASAATIPRTVAAYTLTSAEDVPGRDPGGWHFETTTNGGTNWSRHSTVNTAYFASRHETQCFQAPNSPSVHAFRILIPVNWGASELQLSELTFYELESFTPTPALAVTLPVTNLTVNGATLRGTVNPNGLLTTTWFEWGTTTNYGNSTPLQSKGSGTSVVTNTSILSGLANSTYHYRTVASNALGFVYGDDTTFTINQTNATINVALVGLNNPAVGIEYGDVWGDGNIACLGTFSISANYGVGILDISNPSAPVLRSNYKTALANHNRFEQGIVRNGIGYFASWSGITNGGSANSGGTNSGGLHIVSLTNPAAPVFLSKIGNISGTVTNGFDNVHTMFLERNYLYEAAHIGSVTTVKVFDVSNPFAPVYLRDIETTNTFKIHQITAVKKGENTILYTSGWGDVTKTNVPGQTDIWDVSSIGTQPAVWLGRIYSGFSSHSSWPTPDGNTLIVCRETSGGEVRFYDISTPSNPPLSLVTNPAPFVTISSASMGLGSNNEFPHNPVVVSNLLFVSWYRHGLQIFDISDRTKPIRVGSYDTFNGFQTQSWEGNWGVYPQLGLDKLLVSDMRGGLFILDASAVLTATNNYPPLMVKSPASLTVAQGSTAIFSPVITGSSLKYQWRFNNANIPGATNDSYTIPNVQAINAGNYLVIASNHLGTVTSVAATLSVALQTGPASITSQPQDIAVYAEQSATFQVGVVGAAPFYYQWRFNENNILNATNASFTRPNVQPEEVGAYSVVVSNALGVVTSTNAMLTIIDSPYISNVQATPGGSSALISWTTTVASDSQVQFEQGTTQSLLATARAKGQGSASFSQSSYIDQTPTTNHTILLTGLLPGTRYSFQVISAAGTDHYLSAVYQFTTTEDQDFPTDGSVPNWWEDFYFDGSTDPTLDPDSDGYTTAEEYMMGTSPVDPASSLKSGIQAVGDAANITFWPYLGNRDYQLLSIGDLGAPEWLTIPADSITSSPYGHGTFTVIVTNAAQVFFQLSVQWTTNQTFSGSISSVKTRSFSAFSTDPTCGAPRRVYVK